MGAAITDLLNISSAHLVDLFLVLVGFELAPYLALRWALRAPGIVLPAVRFTTSSVLLSGVILAEVLM